MKFIPILFSTPMVQAILDGRKTQTRRVIKPHLTDVASFIKCPYGKPGDVLWVRETWQETTSLHPSDQNYGYIYKASDNGREWENNSENWKWKPSLFMPKQACRIFLKIKDVRVERLQDIDKQSAINEGVQIIFDAETHVPVYKKYNLKETLGTINPILSFYILWETINGKGSVELNPWVWVIEFEQIEKPKNFL